jgi:uncharacterized protein YndB with AHSA1/START domain
VLRESGFAQVRAEGTRRLYSLDPAPLRSVDEWLDPFRRFWAPHLEARDRDRPRQEEGSTRPQPSDVNRGAGMTKTPEEIIAAQPSAVQRDLTVERDGQTQHTVQTISQFYPTTVDDLWQACTDPERLPRWFAPVSGDLRLGGRYQVEGNASGQVLACEPPHSFAVTWEMGGASTQLAVRLAPEDDGARLTLEHAHTGDADADFWTQFGPGATGVGWDLALLGLSLHLITGQDRPEDPAAFTQTAGARQFIRAASDRWGEASVRAGTPHEDATAAADRTTAFYLGEQPGG